MPWRPPSDLSQLRLLGQIQDLDSLPPSGSYIPPTGRRLAYGWRLSILTMSVAEFALPTLVIPLSAQLAAWKARSRGKFPLAITEGLPIIESELVHCSRCDTPSNFHSFLPLITLVHDHEHC